MIVVLLTCVIFGGLVLVVWLGCSFVFGRNTKSLASWASPYECGFVSSSFSFDSFGFSYFSLLVFFVVFDLEVSLLLNMPEQGIFYDNFYYYFLFLLILSFGFLSEIVWGYVRWGY
uniref:NADH-ubiquinone oxidoreductase chain 3 n=2 Tax=Caryophyllaeidae TaxID=108241 RepID=H9YU34_9CEST|nr:NADH dehydrogenase subunit 3 [Glaridacris catostomi]AFH27202.1 NADH dehydrogenase subunit 3 [Promonobothrium hunteri]